VVVEPGLTVSEQTELDLGGRVLILTAYPTAHTDNDLTVLDRRTGTLWTGDLLFTERVPVVDGSLKGWLDVTAKLRSLDVQLVVPGHGAANQDWPAALDAQERYLRVLLDETRLILSDGGTMEQAVEIVGQSERDGWLLFDDYHPRNVVTAFSELEWE
jgi:glyoxylase-like metal-dependent hydrolase (beta-lactamase superfamily II)